MAVDSKHPRVVIRPYPDIIYLYPTFIAALVCGALVQFVGSTVESPGSVGLVFTLIFFFNLSVTTFDYTRLMSIILVLMLIILALLSTMHPAIGHAISSIADRPLFMNATFYWVWAVGLVILFILAFLRTRFDYWEVKNNELLHHHGLLGDVERWPAPNMRISKEISDVVEYVLCRSGRLVLVPASENRAIVLRNVPGINRIETRMLELLSQLRVADGD